MDDTPRQDEPDSEELAPVRRSKAEIEAGRILFAGACDFVMSVAAMDQLPAADHPEVAFAGRSNVGKSSLLNALTNRKGLARISNTPGRTQLLNYFSLAGKMYLVDMPGYGYAKVSKAQVRNWTRLIHDYLAGRASLTRVFLLIDSRHGIKPNDSEIMDMLDKNAVSYQCVLTKADKPSSAELDRVTDNVAKRLRKRPAAYPEILVTSSRNSSGIEALRAEIAAFTPGP